jgi:hypothetical protein
MSYLPANTRLYMNELRQYSRNTYKLNVLNKTTFAPGDTIEVVLPSSQVVDLSTLWLGFKWQTTGAARMPRGSNCIFSRLEIEAQGTIIQSIQNTHQIWSILQDLTFGQESVQRRKIVENGGAQLAGVGAQENTASDIRVFSFPGLLDSVEPQVLDLSLIGPLRLRLTLAPVSVLTRDAVLMNTLSYSLSSLYFSLDYLEMPPLFYSIQDDYLSRGQVISLPFTHWYTSSQSNTGYDLTHNVQFGSQSIDQVFVTFLDPTATSTGGAADGATNIDAVTGSNLGFKRNASPMQSCYLSVNSVRTPNYDLYPADVYSQLNNILGYANATDGGHFADSVLQTVALTAAATGGAAATINWPTTVALDSLAKFVSDYFCVVFNFTHLGASKEERLTSGINFAGTSGTIAFQSRSSGVTPAASFAGGANISMVIIKTTSVLKVGSGAQIEIVL